MSFVKTASTDPKVKRLHKVTEGVKSSINVAELVKEMKNMLLSRQYRSFDKKIATEHAPKLLDWAGEVATHQSRLADIRLIITDRCMYIEKLISTARKRLLSQYAKDLKGTVTDKRAMVDTVLDDAISVMSDLERLIKLSDIVDKELERSYFNAQFSKQVVETSLRRDHSS